MKNKILLGSSLILLPTFMTLSVSCSNDKQDPKNDKPINPDKPTENIENNLSFNYQNSFVVDLDNDFFLEKNVDDFRKNNSKSIQKKYLEFSISSIDLAERFANNLKEILASVSSNETVSLKSLTSSIDELLIKISQSREIDLNHKLDEFENSAREINTQKIVAVTQNLNTAINDSENKFDNKIINKISEANANYRKSMFNKSTLLTFNLHKSYLEYIKENKPELYQLANNLFQVKTEDKLLQLIQKTLDNFEEKTAEQMSYSFLCFQATIKALTYADLIQNNEIKKGLIIPQKFIHNINFEVQPAFVTTLETWRIFENDLDSSNANSKFIKNSNEDVIGIEYIKNQDRFISNQDEDIDEELTISITNIINEVLKRNPKLKSVTRIKATDKTGAVFITSLSNLVISNISQEKNNDSKINKLTLKRTEGEVNVFPQYTQILQNLITSNLITLSQDDLEFIAIIFNY